MLCQASLQSRYHYVDIRTSSVQALETLVIGVDLVEITIPETLSVQVHNLYNKYPLSLDPSVPAEKTRGPTNPLSAHMDITPFE